MHYTEYFTLRDCSGFLQIRSHICMYINLNIHILRIIKINRCLVAVAKMNNIKFTMCAHALVHTYRVNFYLQNFVQNSFAVCTYLCMCMHAWLLLSLCQCT